MLEGAFFQASNWPTDTGETNGGSISATELTGGLNNIFDLAESDFAGGNAWHRFRKVFWKNTGASDVTSVRVFQQNVKYPGYIRFAVEKNTGDTSEGIESMPDGYSTGDFAEAASIGDALTKVAGGADVASGEDFGFWIWQQVPAGLEDAEPNAPLHIRIAGVTS